MTARHNILLINRDKYLLAQTAKTLQEEGFLVHTALEMRGALSMLSSHPIELIICDKDLQDIGGCDFLSFIKKDPLREKIPFMFYVSLNDQGYPREGFQLGAVDYVVYPIDTQALVGRMNDALEAQTTADPTTATGATMAGRTLGGRTLAGAGAVSAVPNTKAMNTQTPSAAADQAQSPFETPLNVEVSRDGVIWLPSKITQFFRQDLTMETSMMGKAGVAIMIRIKQPDESIILNGIIKDISFNDFQKPAGLEIKIKEDDNWRRVLAGAKIEEKPSGLREEIMAATVTIAGDQVSTTYSSASGQPPLPEEPAPRPDAKTAQRESSYDKRFYQSLIGKHLDSYRAMSVLGIGNMGGVLQGWDVALEREVALKIISYKLSSKETFRNLFIKEARVISKLNHPNIAQIYSIGSSNEILYYAMEFIDGITLRDIIKKEGRLDIQKGLTYLRSVCGALEVVYENSIVHRDIKPANLMITRSDVVKIVDFGVAKTHDARSGGGGKKGLYGTPMYMSPEQIAGLAIDHRSDMYSLGATFYHAFCGTPPFRADDVKQLLSHHLNTPLTPLNEINAKIPSQLSQVIEKMMAKDPFERFKSFSAITEEIRHIQV